MYQVQLQVDVHVFYNNYMDSVDAVSIVVSLVWDVVIFLINLGYILEYIDQHIQLYIISHI